MFRAIPTATAIPFQLARLDNFVGRNPTLTTLSLRCLRSKVECGSENIMQDL